MLIEREHGGNLVLEHLAHGNAGPGGNDVAHDLGIDAHANERRFTLHRFELARQLGQLLAQGVGIHGRLRHRGLAVTRGGRGSSFELRPHFADTRDKISLFFPAFAHGREPAFGLGAMFRDLFQALAMIRAERALALEYARLHAQIVERPRGIFDRRGNRVLPERQPRARRVQHADGFIG